MSPADLRDATVGSLWRYPVKSMAGERLDAAELRAQGLLGDRAFALVDRHDGKVATAKNPRKWPSLFHFAASLGGRAPADGRAGVPPVVVTLPDGTSVRHGHPGADERLSQALGREVLLRQAGSPEVQVVGTASARPWVARSEELQLDFDGRGGDGVVADFELPEGTFFDAAPVHLLTTASLARLQQLHPAGQMAIRRFRPNVVVDTGGLAPGFVEDAWVGRTLRLGAAVRLAVTQRCVRCVMTTLPQGGLPKDSGVLRTAAQHNDVCVGVYAGVLSGGLVRSGDRVTLE
ncbi:MAG TPA: MOSC N-terminal beta barrel domain-containing protein [Nocardioidaceae bacterium]|nr:MOSC N-terminal beta barrel domain-containing protein [Nocardioidaceae bacterium]